MQITLGNVAPIEVHHHDPDDPKHKARLKDAVGGYLVTRGADPATKKPIQDLVIPLDVTESHTTWMSCPVDWTAIEIVASVAGISAASSSHMWAYHSTKAPGWVTVEADDGDVASADLVRQMLQDIWGIDNLADKVKVLVTNAGLDYASKQLGGAASATAIAVNMALTANATAPAAGDTTLTGEIVTGGGGLIRAAAAYAHTAAASTYTLTKTFTANGSDSLPVTVNKMALFDAAASGNMPFETAISPAITFNASGDAGTITETVTV